MKEARGDLEKAFGKQLTAAMAKSRVSRRQVAEVLDCSHQAVRNYMIGAFFPKQEKLNALEDFLKVKFIMGNPNIFEPKYDNLEEPASSENLTITQAKIALSKSLGVPPEKIKILIEG